MYLPRRLLILLPILFVSIPSFAQKAHNTKPNSQCRFVKGPKNMEGMTPCDACFEQRKKDEAAVKAEYDKRMKANKAAEAQKLQARLDDLKQKNAAEKKAREAQAKNVVTFALPESKPVKKQEVKTIVPPATQKDYLYTEWPARIYYNASGLNRFVLNKKGDTILNTNGQFAGFQGVGLNTATDQSKDFPAGVVIAAFKNGESSYYPKYWDIVDAKGQRLLNDDNIIEIYHIAGDYFLLGDKPGGGLSGFDYPHARIYNLKTKETLELPRNPSCSGVCVKKVNTHLNKDKCREVIAEPSIGYVIQCTNFPEEFTVYFVRKDGSLDKKIFYDLD